MAILKRIKINGEEVKQLWYGLNQSNDDNDYNDVYSGYSCENKLTYAEEPYRDLDGNLHNKEIATFYIPTATFTFSYVNIDVYRKIIQSLNVQSFTVEYYDYEIDEYVIRDMYMTDKSLSNLHNIGENLIGAIDLKLTFVSRLAYKNYNELKTKKINEFDIE